MSRIKVAVLAAAATLAVATPTLAQNFQGFGAPSSITEGQAAAQTKNKPVALKTTRHAKHAKQAH
jgi:hypothetical protein